MDTSRSPYWNPLMVGCAIRAGVPLPDWDADLEHWAMSARTDRDAERPAIVVAWLKGNPNVDGCCITPCGTFFEAAENIEGSGNQDGDIWHLVGNEYIHCPMCGNCDAYPCGEKPTGNVMYPDCFELE